MSARQAFVPRPSSCVPSSESLSRPSMDGNKAMSAHGSGKARSISAFLGQKRGGADTAPQGPGLGRTNSSTSTRNFEGLLRPEMAPISLIPYPATAQLGTGVLQPGAGQTPRKTAGLGVFEFPRPITPESAPRNPKKGFGMFAENRGDEATANGHGSDTMFMGSASSADVRVGSGTRTGAYMRVLERPSGGGSAGDLQPDLESEMAAPVPEYALRGLGANLEDDGCEIDRMFARSSRSSGTMAEEEVGIERNSNSQRNLAGTKRGMDREDMEGNRRYTDEGDPTTQGATKRLRQTQHDPTEDYFPISSPQMPATPRPPTASVDVPEPTLVVGLLFENVDEFISLEEIAADWKRWKECTREEWLEGVDELAKDYTDILNMVKDHLTEKVLAFSSMASSVEEKQAELSRNNEMIHKKGDIVRENVSKLGMKN